MGRKKKEGNVSAKLVKNVDSKAIYEPRHDGLAGSVPSRRKIAVRESWHPDAIPEDALYFGDDDEPQLSVEELHLAREISNARR